MKAFMRKGEGEGRMGRTRHEGTDYELLNPGTSPAADPGVHRGGGVGWGGRRREEVEQWSCLPSSWPHARGIF